MDEPVGVVLMWFANVLSWCRVVVGILLIKSEAS